MTEVTQTWSDLDQSIKEQVESGAGSRDLQEALAAALAKLNQAEQEIFRSELEEFVHWKKQWTRWLRVYQKIFRELPQLIGEMQEIVFCLTEDDQFMEAPVEVQERLRNRKEGLEIIFRMLKRLPQRQEMLAKTVENGIRKLEKLELDTEDYITRVGQLEESQVQPSKVNEILEEIENKETAVRDENYHRTRKLRQKAEALKQAVAGFLRDHLLPVIDGLERGLWDQAQLKQPLSQYQSEMDLIDKWFGTYHGSYKLMKICFKKIGLKRLKVQRGDEFDPQRHMALGHETSSELADGLILEVARSGWNYYSFSIRSAEVLVVRNEEGKSDEQQKSEA